jgi:hypothetical protein
MKRQIMGREVVVAITKGELDFGPWEQIFYGELTGAASASWSRYWGVGRSAVHRPLVTEAPDRAGEIAPDPLVRSIPNNIKPHLSAPGLLL